MHTKSIPKHEILRLCELLGHDPEKVSMITIHPAYVIVEHLHPITDSIRPVSEHRIEDVGGEG